MTPIPPLSIGGEVLGAIDRHARESWPRECCGLLIGDTSAVAAAWPSRNLARRAGRYLVDPRDYLAAVRVARADGRAVIGAYHSHVSAPPLPSPRDEAESVGGGFVYLIVGPLERRAVRRYRGRPGLGRRRRRGWAPASVTAWRAGTGNFDRVPLVRET